MVEGKKEDSKIHRLTPFLMWYRGNSLVESGVFWFILDQIPLDPSFFLMHIRRSNTPNKKEGICPA